MDITLEDETSCTIQYQEAFLMYVENKFCAKHRCIPVNKHQSLLCSYPISSAMASGSFPSSFDPYDLSGREEEYLMPNNVAETTPGRSHRAARLLSAARLDFNSPPEAPRTWGLITTNLNDYHSDPVELSSIIRILDITDWWSHQEETHPKCADVS
jgi:hypothetical protein